MGSLGSVLQGESGEVGEGVLVGLKGGYFGKEKGRIYFEPYSFRGRGRKPAQSHPIRFRLESLENSMEKSIL